MNVWSEGSVMTDDIGSVVRPNERRIQWTLLSLALLVLITVPVAAQEQTPLARQPATETPEEYFTAIRRAVMATGPSQEESAPPPDPDVPEVLKDCLDPESDFGMKRNDPDFLPTVVARDLKQFTNNLLRLRIPPMVWAGHLQALTEIAVEYIGVLRRSPSQKKTLSEETSQRIEREEKRLAASVSGYARTQSPRSREVVLQEGCGAGEVPVVIRTQPAGAQVAYIPLFKFKLCEARKLPPQDPLSCTGWVNAVKKAEFLSGKYAYIARWSDGRSTSGVFNINDFWDTPTNEEEEIRVTITR